MTTSRSPASPTPRAYPRWKPRLLAMVAVVATRALAATLRFRLDDPTGRFRPDSQETFLFALWHNRIGIMPVVRRKFLRNRRIVALVSASRDGEILAETLAMFGFAAVRGSTSRRGAQSLLEMVRFVQSGYDAVITPDGPRGPAEVAQRGVVELAKLTGCPITPVSCAVSRCYRLRSWDRFIIPWPGARFDLRIGPPIPVPPDADLESVRAHLQEVLRRLGEGTG